MRKADEVGIQVTGAVSFETASLLDAVVADI